jgi:hypothetical protein
MSTPKANSAHGLRARRERLAREVAEIEAKAARLKTSAANRRKTLNRLDAQLVLSDEAGLGCRRDE